MLVTVGPLAATDRLRAKLTPPPPQGSRRSAVLRAELQGLPERYEAAGLLSAPSHSADIRESVCPELATLFWDMSHCHRLGLVALQNTLDRADLAIDGATYAIHPDLRELKCRADTLTSAARSMAGAERNRALELEYSGRLLFVEYSRLRTQLERAQSAVVADLERTAVALHTAYAAVCGALSRSGLNPPQSPVKLLQPEARKIDEMSPTPVDLHRRAVPRGSTAAPEPRSLFDVSVACQGLAGKLDVSDPLHHISIRPDPNAQAAFTTLSSAVSLLDRDGNEKSRGEGKLLKPVLPLNFAPTANGRTIWACDKAGQFSCGLRVSGFEDSPFKVRHHRLFERYRELGTDVLINARKLYLGGFVANPQLRGHSKSLDSFYNRIHDDFDPDVALVGYVFVGFESDLEESQGKVSLNPRNLNAPIHALLNRSGFHCTGWTSTLRDPAPLAPLTDADDDPQFQALLLTYVRPPRSALESWGDAPATRRETMVSDLWNEIQGSPWSPAEAKHWSNLQDVNLDSPFTHDGLPCVSGAEVAVQDAAARANWLSQAQGKDSAGPELQRAFDILGIKGAEQERREALIAALS